MEIVLDKPKITTKEIDIEEVYEAIKKNGYAHLRGSWIDISGKGGCVLGQAGINLKAAANSDPFIQFWNEYTSGSSAWWMVGNIENFRDEEDQLYTLVDQLNRYDLDGDNKWYTDEASPGLGNAIVYWNDKTHPELVNGVEKVVFDLPTYEDVVNMAYDILEPYFGNKITVMDYDYGI